MGYIFEWDARKAASNTKKNGVSFDEATTVFGDPLSLLMDDPKHSEDEKRFLVLGF
ncbi:MAG: BrnT family toxin [Desulfuromonadales bacterium]